MSEFPKLSLRKYPKTQEHESNEAKYWRSFSLTKHEKLLGSPNCISFNPNDSRQYIVTYSTMISLFDTLNDGIVRSYTRFNDGNLNMPIYSCYVFMYGAYSYTHYTH